MLSYIATEYLVGESLKEVDRRLARQQGIDVDDAAEDGARRPVPTWTPVRRTAPTPPSAAELAPYTSD